MDTMKNEKFKIIFIEIDSFLYNSKIFFTLNPIIYNSLTITNAQFLLYTTWLL